MVSAEVGEGRRGRDQQRDARHRAEDDEGGQDLAKAHRACPVEEDRAQDEEAKDRRVTRQGSVSPAGAGVQTDEAGEVFGQVADVHDRDLDALA